MSEKLLPDSFRNKIKFTNSCWIWIGAIQSNGYGNFRSLLAHRVSYEFMVGKIPKGMTIDHLCKNRRCVNPNHMEPVTQKENNSRSSSITSVNEKKTHCSNGHELSSENIKIIVRKDGTRRKCKLCARLHKSQARSKKN